MDATPEVSPTGILYFCTINFDITLRLHWYYHCIVTDWIQSRWLKHRFCQKHWDCYCEDMWYWIQVPLICITMYYHWYYYAMYYHLVLNPSTTDMYYYVLSLILLCHVLSLSITSGITTYYQWWFYKPGFCQKQLDCCCEDMWYYYILSVKILTSPGFVKNS